MSQHISSPFRVSPEIVAGVMEGSGAQNGTADRLRGLAWLMILEEAEGKTRLQVAETAGVPLLDIEELRYYLITGTEFALEWDEERIQAECSKIDSIWLAGLAAVRTSAMLTQQAIGQGWDQVEAIAIDKVAQYLSSMQALGNPLELIEIASKANKAIRRNRGEGSGRGNGGFNMAGSQNSNGGTEINASIPIENGTMTLNISQNVRRQIEAAHGPVVDSASRASGLKSARMLDVKQTRELVQTEKETSAIQETEIDSDPFAAFLSDFGEDNG